MKNTDKEDHLEELTKAMSRFHEAKVSKDQNQIKYYKGFSEGIMHMLLKMNIVTKNELYEIIENAELDIPTIYRGTSNARE